MIFGTDLKTSDCTWRRLEERSVNMFGLQQQFPGLLNTKHGNNRESPSVWKVCDWERERCCRNKQVTVGLRAEGRGHILSFRDGETEWCDDLMDLVLGWVCVSVCVVETQNVGNEDFTLATVFYSIMDVFFLNNFSSEMQLECGVLYVLLMRLWNRNVFF